MMDKPIFVDFETRICSAYLNAVATTVWDALGQATNPQEARQFIGAVEEAPTDGSSYARQNAQWVQIQVGNLHNDLAGRSAPDAHPVSAITGLQASLDQINLDLSGKAPASAGTAAGTSFSPTGSIAATNVQSALAEVDGDVTANTGAIAALNNSLNLLDAAAVKKSSLTGAAFIPSGTTAQRDTAQLGAFRYNIELDLFEGVGSLGWGPVGGGITQSQADARYLQLTGGTLSGNLTAVASYVSTAQENAGNALTRKDYVDGAFRAKAYQSSEVIQQRLFTDAGRGVSGTGFTDATVTLKNFTPKSTNSTIVIDVILRGDIGAVSALNAVMNYQIFEGSVSNRLGSTMSLGATTSSGGLGATAGVSVRASVQNTGLGSRNFGIAGWTNSGSASGSLTLQSWAITEIQN